jgi:Hsp70 protein
MTDELKQILCDLIERHGRELVREPKRLEGMLNDACAGQHRGARRVLVDAVQERVVEELLALGPGEHVDVVVGRAQQRLIENLAIAPDTARWAIQAWAAALQVCGSMVSVPDFGEATINDAELDDNNESSVAPLPQRGRRPGNPLGATQYPRTVSSTSHRLRGIPAVGIDLGTTSSCIAYLNEHGEPVTLPNEEGELSTPSVVMFDGGEVIVGTEALRNAVLKPTHVVQNSKRYIGSHKTWQIQGATYTPVDIGSLILRKMISAAEEQIGEIKQAVITVPAQFSDRQRQATVEAGFKAGLKIVDIVNEPVAIALCYVLGMEGRWFTELTDEQRILVYDLGSHTFELFLVSFRKDEVKVIASTGDLHLGGIDWNETLQNAICDRFAREFGADPRIDPESMQLLAMAVENTKRGLTVRPRAALTCTHGGHRKVYQVEQTEFEKLTKSLLDRTLSITRDLQKAYNFGLKPTDVILTTGDSSRMPMIKRGLGEIGFRTPNTSLSPDQSISNGATYYAGMLLSTC